MAVSRQDWLEQTKRDAQLNLAFKSQPLFMIQILTIVSVLFFGVWQISKATTCLEGLRAYTISKNLFFPMPDELPIRSHELKVDLTIDLKGPKERPASEERGHSAEQRDTKTRTGSEEINREGSLV